MGHGRWGGRASVAQDINIQSLYNLFERPGTGGEKEGARQAIIRHTAKDPAQSSSQSQSSYSYAQPQQPKNTGPKFYTVRCTYEWNGKNLNDSHGFEAGEERED